MENGWRYLFLLDDEELNELKQIFAADADSVAAEKRIAILSRVPTLLGWRLPEASGWLSAHLPDCEAEILAECADLILAEEEDRKAAHPSSLSNQSQAKQLFSLAVAIHPQHVRSYIALAQYELGRHKALLSKHKHADREM